MTKRDCSGPILIPGTTQGINLYENHLFSTESDSNHNNLAMAVFHVLSQIKNLCDNKGLSVKTNFPVRAQR